MGGAVPFAFQDSAEVARRFPDLHPAFSPQEALTEANRCLNCFDAPCAAACPTHIDVPRFIKKIGTQNLMGSALTILDANILGASCSRVCPVEVLCEGACVMLRYNKQPIAIGRLQRHAMDHFFERGAPLAEKIGAETQPENRVHRRGSGVAGVRGGIGPARILRHCDGAASIARWVEHVWRGGVQTAGARQSARSGDDRGAGSRSFALAFPLRAKTTSRHWSATMTRSLWESGWAP